MVEPKPPQLPKPPQRYNSKTTFQKQFILTKFVNNNTMRFRHYTIILSVMILLSSCKLWNSVFKPKYGCPSNGKNVGAEKILSGDPKASKDMKKAKKFKS